MDFRKKTAERNRFRRSEKERVGSTPQDAPVEGRLLSKEDREEHDTFDQSGQNDGQRQDVTSSAWIATSGFSSFRTEQADADSSTDSGQSNVEITGQFSEDRECGHICSVWLLLVFRFPQFSLWSKREKVSDARGLLLQSARK